MKLQVVFESQAKVAADTSRAEYDMPSQCGTISREQMLALIASQASEPLQQFLLDSNGEPRSSLLVFQSDNLIPAGSQLDIANGHEVVITSLISGG